MAIVYLPLNLSDPGEVRFAAEIHELAPRNWNPSHIVREERIQFWCDFLNRAKQDPSIFTITARTESAAIVGIHWLRLTEKYNEKCAHIQSLWVNENHRRMGIGAELKRRGEEWAKRNGAKFIVTEVFYNNREMINYNLTLGFSARQVEMVKDL